MMKDNPITDIYPILVGLMGSGKSSIGRRLAFRLQLPLVDLDDEIVNKAGCSIPELFAEHGEAGFRDLESRMLAEVIGKPAVLATGGGIVMRDANCELLKQHPPVIWLKASPEFLAHRIEGDANRPLIADGDTLNKLQELARIRYPRYEACADFVLPRGDMQKSEALAAIIEFLADWKKHSASC